MHPPNHLTRLTRRVMKGEDLPREDAEHAFQIIISGGGTPAQIAAFVTALSMKGESVEEIVGAVTALRAKGLPFSAPTNAIDVCGTGGDNRATLNISTAVAFVVAGCGVPVAKHGNRAVSSISGSSDVLSRMGVKIDAHTAAMERAIREANIAFLFAPHYHACLRHVSAVRAELGYRTVFNLLGPLANPARTRRQLLGVYDARWLEPLARVLRQLGVERAWVVHGADGLDELSTTGPSEVAELKDGQIRRFTLTSEDTGLAQVSIKDLQGRDADHNAGELQRLLSGHRSPYRDVVLLNAAAALIVAQEAQTIREGIALAAASIDGGRAKESLRRLVCLAAEEKVTADDTINR